MTKLAAFVIGFLAFFVFTKLVFAVTLFSEGFESGVISTWSSSGGGATAAVSTDTAHSGTYSIKVSHDKTSSYGFQTIIQNIEPGMFYEISGFGKPASNNIASYFVRVAWYASQDGSGSQLSVPNDSNSGASSDSDWVKLSTNAIQAPSNANSAKVRLVLTANTSGQQASAYFDDIAFNEAAAPPPSPLSSPSPTPSPQKSPSPTPTPIKSPSPSPLKSPTPEPLVLGESSRSSTVSANYVSPTPPLQVSQNNAKLPIVLAGAGLILIGLSSGFYLWYSKLLGKSQADKQEEDEND